MTLLTTEVLFYSRASLRIMFRPWRILGKVKAVGNKLISPLASLNQQTVAKIEEWDELKQLMMKGIMGSQAQYKLVQTPVNRSANLALDICASYCLFIFIFNA